MCNKLSHKVRSVLSIPTCPTSCRWEGDLVGCGSSNVVWDEGDELFDCFNCGLFFNREQAFLHQDSKNEAM